MTQPNGTHPRADLERLVRGALYPLLGNIVCMAICAISPSAYAQTSAPGSTTIAVATPSVAPHESPPAPPTLQASIDDGVVIQDASQNYRFALRNLARFRYQLDVVDGDVSRNEFLISMMRPQLRIAFWQQKLDIFVQPELAGAHARLLDAQLTYTARPEFRVRVGQYVTPMTRDFWTAVPLLLFPDFSHVNTEFRADRDTGVTLFGTVADGLFEYYASVLNGPKLSLPNNDNTRLMYLARLVINPLGPLAYDGTIGADGNAATRFAIGINAYNNVITPHTSVLDPMTQQLVDQTGPDTNQSVLGADLGFAAGPFHAMAEGFYRHRTQWIDGPDPSVDAWGAYGMAAVYVAPPWLEIATRVGHLDIGGSATPSTVIEGLAQYYAVGNHLRTGLLYQATVVSRQVNHRVLLQTQMW